MRLYNSAKSIIDKNAPCKFSNNVCSAGKINGCCGTCNMHSNNKGCLAISLFCKLYLCDIAVKNMNTEDLQKLNELKEEATALLNYDDRFRNSDFSNLTY